MDFSDLRPVDGVLSLALTCLGLWVQREGARRHKRDHEIAELRVRREKELAAIHTRLKDLSDSVQAELLKRVVIEKELENHLDFDEQMHARIEAWLAQIDERFERLFELLIGRQK